jgi:lipopolysaccharide export system protein LptA
MKSRILTDLNLFNRRRGLWVLALFLAVFSQARAQQGPTSPTAPKGEVSPASTIPTTANSPLDVDNRKTISPEKPVNITSNQLSFDKLNGLTLFNGAVKVTHDQIILNSDQVEAASNNRVATALGNVRVNDLKSNLHLTCGNLDYHDLMDQITAHDHPVIDTLDENGMPMTIRSRQMELYTQQKKVVAHQDVEILHDTGRSEAQLATYDAKTDQVVLEENPRVFTPQGVISGRRITTNLSGDHRLIVEGMAEAEFYSTPQPIPTKPPGAGTSTPLGPGMGVTTNGSSGSVSATGSGSSSPAAKIQPGGGTGPAAVPIPGL